MQKLLLWDVDGTLLHTAGISGEVMRAAMSQVFGTIMRQERTFYSGKTDWQIIQESFPDLSPTVLIEQLPLFMQTYVAEFQRRQADIVARGRAMPGTLPLLARLTDYAIQAPLTGNIAPIARLKLDWLGLGAFMHFAVGAYGNDHADRPQLVAIAAERATRLFGRPFSGRDLVIIGDTPHDVRCGKLNGTRTVAVATGPYTIRELQNEDPDVILPDLHNLDAALAAILA